jgi:hypothetical protein
MLLVGLLLTMALALLMLVDQLRLLAHLVLLVELQILHPLLKLKLLVVAHLEEFPPGDKWGAKGKER